MPYPGHSKSIGRQKLIARSCRTVAYTGTVAPVHGALMWSKTLGTGGSSSPMKEVRAPFCNPPKRMELHHNPKLVIQPSACREVGDSMVLSPRVWRTRTLVAIQLRQINSTTR